jgi:hypothetical protein
MNRRRDESGQLASIELLPFGILVFCIGVLFFGQVWAVVDAKSAVDAAAREATRAFVEGHNEASASAAASASAQQSMAASGRDVGRMSIAAQGPLVLERCQRISFEVAYDVPLLTAPLLPSWGNGIRVSASHSEIVDPYRDGLTGDGCG